MKNFRLSKEDVKILEYLKFNSRMHLTDLSKRVGLPVSTVHDRVRKFVVNGVAKFTLVLAPQYRKAYYEMQGGEGFTCDHGRTELDHETGECVCLDCGDEVWK